MDRKVRNLRADEEKKHFEMLNLCFQQWGDKEKWQRRYKQPNFNLTENIVIVEENNEWIGGGTAWFRDAFLRNNRRTRVYVAGDGYVHPDHRGKGVYSTFMKSLNELARTKKASLGFGFISNYGTPFKALPKYGFVDVFYPSTRILILNPNKFFNFLSAQLEGILVPNRFEELKLKLTISFTILKRKHEITKVFRVEEGSLRKVEDHTEDAEDVDLSIKADVGTLLEILRCFYLKKRTRFLSVFVGFLSGRFRMRFSRKLIRMALGSK